MISKNGVMALLAEIACLTLKAQTNEWTMEWTRAAESAFEWIDIHSKLDLNHSQTLEFISQGFTEAEAKCIVDHREQYGSWIHLTELQRCGFTTERIGTVKKLLYPLIPNQLDSLDQLGFWLHPKTNSTASVLLKDTWSSGVTHHLQNQIQWGNIAKLNILTQTDAGEKPFDYKTISWELKNLGFLKQIIIGKYQWNWNQGLVQNAPYAIGRSFDIGSWVNNQQELKASISQNEDLGVWGVGTRISFRNFQLFASVGTRKFDSQLNETKEGFIDRKYGGLHISALDLSRKSNNQFYQYFGGFKTQLKQHEMNISWVFYHYQIPRIHLNQTIQQEHILEYQHVFKNLFHTRSLVNIARSSLGLYACYVSVVKTLHPKLDWAVRYSHIPSLFYSPERSPYMQSDIGKTFFEMGLDLVLDKKKNLQLRTIRESSIEPIDLISMEIPKSFFQIQYIYQKRKDEFLQMRLKQEQIWGLKSPFQFELQYKNEWSKNWGFKIHYQWKSPKEFSSANAALLTQITIKNSLFSTHFYSVHYQSDETTYMMLPSAQYPWRLGIFSGRGTAYGITLKQKLTKKIIGRFSMEWVNNHEPIKNHNQIPRIFVQLEYL